MNKGQERWLRHLVRGVISSQLQITGVNKAFTNMEKQELDALFDARDAAIDAVVAYVDKVLLEQGGEQ